MKRPVSFFLAEYEDSDPLGYLLAFLSLTPPFLVAIQATVYGTLLLLVGAPGPFHRTLRKPAQLAGMVLLGQLLNELLNLALKNVLRSPRPVSEAFTSDYGMPSSHSQFMTFLMASFPALSRRLAKQLKWPFILQLSINTAAFFGTFLIAFGR